MVPLRIAILTSHSAPGAAELLRDPNRGAVYELVAVIRSDAELGEVELTEILRDLDPDYLFLVGYEHGIPALPMTILKLHDGVSDVLYEGANETRSTLTFVNDDGKEPLFLQSQPFPVASLARDARTWGDADLLSDYAALHRRWMIRATWGPMLTRAIEFLAAGTVKIVHDVVWIDGAPGPCRLGSSPEICQKVADTIDVTIPASCPFLRA
jgi:hypothetical protein